MKTTLKLAGAAIAATLIGGAQPSLASSHREAPLISEDPAVDATDFYMFRSPTQDTGAAANTVTFVANYWPMEEPGAGPNWMRFSDSALYEIKIDNNGDAKEDITYQFRFTTNFKAGATSFLFAKGGVTTPTDNNLNVVQTYTVTRVDKTGSSVVVNNGVVPPPYLGDMTIPAYTTVANAAISPIGTGKVFAGQRDDPFYADLGAIFDLVRIRCSAAGGGQNKAAGCAGQAAANTKGVDFLAGYNVQSIVLQIPIAQLTSDGSTPSVSSKTSILGAWTTASRPRVTIRRAPSIAGIVTVKESDSYGQWVQVSRLGLPLINEVIVPVGLKDYYNSTPPSNDAALFTGPGKPLLQDPELTKALVALYGPAVTTSGSTRTDLLDLVQFQIGTQAMPTGPFKGATAAYGLTPADILRVDVAVPAPTNFVSTGNRLGALQPDANFGFPNGRRLGDDVVDILERVVGGGVLTGNMSAVNGALGDAVDANDGTFTLTFPYLAPPWSGSQVGIPSTGGVGGTTPTNTNYLHQFR